MLPEDSERVDGLDACQGPNKAFLSPEICEFLLFLDFWSFDIVQHGQLLVQICIIQQIAPSPQMVRTVSGYLSFYFDE